MYPLYMHYILCINPLYIYIKVKKSSKSECDLKFSVNVLQHLQSHDSTIRLWPLHEEISLYLNQSSHSFWLIIIHQGASVPGVGEFFWYPKDERKLEWN